MKVRSVDHVCSILVVDSSSACLRPTTEPRGGAQRLCHHLRRRSLLLVHRRRHRRCLRRRRHAQTRPSHPLPVQRRPFEYGLGEGVERCTACHGGLPRQVARGRRQLRKITRDELTFSHRNALDSLIQILAAKSRANSIDSILGTHRLPAGENQRRFCSVQRLDEIDHCVTLQFRRGQVRRRKRADRGEIARSSVSRIDRARRAATVDHGVRVLRRRYLYLRRRRWKLDFVPQGQRLHQGKRTKRSERTRPVPSWRKHQCIPTW